MEVKCKNCDNYNPELKSCSRLEKEFGDDYLSFVMDDDSCSTEEGAVPISNEEFHNKWLWYLVDRNKNHKYIVYLGNDSINYSRLLGCFDTKELAIDFATGAVLSFSNYTLDRDDVRNKFYETYQNHDAYHEVTGFAVTSDLVMSALIGIIEVPYYEG